MPVPHVDIQNGSVTGGLLTDGCNFKWSNPTGSWVSLSGCGGFCTKTGYNVPPMSNGVYGTMDAQILANPTSYSFTDPAWNAPGQPHIVVDPWPTPSTRESGEHHEHQHHHEHKKDVA